MSALAKDETFTSDSLQLQLWAESSSNWAQQSTACSKAQKSPVLKAPNPPAPPLLPAAPPHGAIFINSWTQQQQLLHIQNPTQFSARAALSSRWNRIFNFYFLALGRRRKKGKGWKYTLSRFFENTWITFIAQKTWNKLHSTENC